MAPSKRKKKEEKEKQARITHYMNEFNSFIHLQDPNDLDDEQKIGQKRILDEKAARSNFILPDGFRE